MAIRDAFAPIAGNAAGREQQVSAIRFLARQNGVTFSRGVLTALNTGAAPAIARAQQELRDAGISVPAGLGVDARANAPMPTGTPMQSLPQQSILADEAGANSNVAPQATNEGGEKSAQKENVASGATTEQGNKKEDSSLPPEQAAQTNDGIPAIDESSLEGASVSPRPVSPEGALGTKAVDASSNSSISKNQKGNKQETSDELDETNKAPLDTGRPERSTYSNDASSDSTIPQNQKDSNKKEKNPDGTDVFVRSEPTADGTVSPSEQNPSAPNISQNQTQGNLVLGDKTAVKVFADSLTYDNIQMGEIPQELLSEINGSSNEENLQRAVDYIESRKGKQFTDPLGNQLYFEPGNTESMEQYALHLIAGKDASDEMDLSKVRDSRVLGVLLAQKTLESPLAVVEQKNNHRRVYISIYRGDVNYANSLVIGVEKGQDGRIVTVFMSGSKRDKKAALRELKNRLSGENTEKVLYISDGLYGHSRPTTEPRTSQGSVSLRPSGNQSVPQNQQKSNQKSTSKHSESQGAFSIGKINGKHQAKLENAARGTVCGGAWDDCKELRRHRKQGEENLYLQG